MNPIRPFVLDLQPSGIGQIAREGLGDPDIIPLWFGESDLTSPGFVNDAAKKALDAGKTFYDWTRGHIPVREGLLRYHAKQYGIELDPDRISAPGSTMLTVMLACQCLVEPGDEVILVSPYWPNIRTVVQALGGGTVDVRLREGPRRWHLDMDDVKRAITHKTKAVYVNTPSNPTGWVMSREEQVALLTLCRARGIAIISDEVYHRNVFDQPGPAPSFVTIAEPEEPVFILNGWSKAWAMTGWRLGWMVHPKQLAVPISVLSEVNNTGATAFVQYGGLAALDEGDGFVHDFVARCAFNRQLAVEILGSHPKLDMLVPEGAFYLFPRIKGSISGLDFARRLLREEKVGIAPGFTFGEGNDAHVRICFALSTARLEEAFGRIRRLLDRI
ncbi:MAG TPA: pyridoxal phosphate-dependent aminotransferase [Geminicoccus sp.]|jgi:aspartate/methionine/tyrosine aminotransferase|uniref:pyridoxal phosphate-dependent aminotransferase n=1 Tax=Geminicoccus sp. TaxID=2024832 RepID=UPI002E35A6AB|nr:pyridoxal phosphate-dependent aminotransferase [Geminicoccus sp.]HEX2527900.1 pyridoxal phosphate-dependent aminotransferase [Geminicoccus sp.]